MGQNRGRYLGLLRSKMKRMDDLLGQPTQGESRDEVP